MSEKISGSLKSISFSTSKVFFFENLPFLKKEVLLFSERFYCPLRHVYSDYRNRLFFFSYHTNTVITFLIGYSASVLESINLFLKRGLLITSYYSWMKVDLPGHLFFIGACFWGILSKVLLNVPNEIWENLDKALSNSCIKASLGESLYFLYWMIFDFCLL